MNSFLSASIKIDGVKYNAFELENESVNVEITETGNGYTYRKMVLSNPSDKNSGQITEPRVIDAVIPCKEQAFFHTIWGCNCNAKSFQPIEYDMQVGDAVTIEPLDGNSSSGYGAPFMDVVVDGKAYLFSIGWTGEWICTIERTEDAFILKGGIKFIDLYIKPGESLNLASVCIIEGKDGEDAFALRRRFRKLLMTDMSPLPEGVEKIPIAATSGNPLYLSYKPIPECFTYENQFKNIRRIQEFEGFDTYWLDANWFTGGFPAGVGNYSFHQNFPDGLKPVFDEAHRAGLKTLLWFEPFRVVRGTETHVNYPDYLSYVDWKVAPVMNTDENCFLLNIGREEVYQHLYKTVSDIIRDNGVDIYREDNNFPPLDFWTRNDEPNRLGINEIHFINNLYRYWDSLREEFPGLYVDNCASGGRRYDFESMRRSVALWRCDGGGEPVTPERDTALWNQNQTISLSEYLPFHATSAHVPEAYECRSALTAGFVHNFDIHSPDFDDEKGKAAIAEIAYYSNYWLGDFYPLTKHNFEDNCFLSYQLAKGDNGYATVFRRAECEDSEFTIKFNSIKPYSIYTLRLVDEDRNVTEKVVRGMDLENGYTVTLPKKRSSLIAEYLIMD